MDRDNDETYLIGSSEVVMAAVYVKHLEACSFQRPDQGPPADPRESGQTVTSSSSSSSLPSVVGRSNPAFFAASK